jgi:hypothetical protein
LGTPKIHPRDALSYHRAGRLLFIFHTGSVVLTAANKVAEVVEILGRKVEHEEAKHEIIRAG